MSRYTVSISGDLENKLEFYMKQKNITKKTTAIRECVETATNNENILVLFNELDKKLNRVLYRQNMYRKLLEQFFVNMGFSKNQDANEDLLLKEFYDNNNKYMRFE